MEALIHFDGGSRGNPGPAGAGIVVQEAQSGTLLHEGGYFLGRMTNNAAEYEALLRALGQAQRLGARRVNLLSDSELLVRQMLGQYKVKSEKLKPLHASALDALAVFDDWSIRHVRREQNTRADELANLAMDAETDVVAEEPVSGEGETGAEIRRFRATLACEGTCPFGQRGGRAYKFGPTTPAGFCLEGARVVLSCPDDADEVVCPHCACRIEIKRG